MSDRQSQRLSSTLSSVASSSAEVPSSLLNLPLQASSATTGLPSEYATTTANSVRGERVARLMHVLCGPEPLPPPIKPRGGGEEFEQRKAAYSLALAGRQDVWAVLQLKSDAELADLLRSTEAKMADRVEADQGQIPVPSTETLLADLQKVIAAYKPLRTLKLESSAPADLPLTVERGRFWMNADRWHSFEAAWLLCGLEPPEEAPDGPDFWPSTEAHKAAVDSFDPRHPTPSGCLAFILRAQKTGALEAGDAPATYLPWAYFRGFRIPPALVDDKRRDYALRTCGLVIAPHVAWADHVQYQNETCMIPRAFGRYELRFAAQVLADHCGASSRKMLADMLAAWRKGDLRLLDRDSQAPIQPGTKDPLLLELALPGDIDDMLTRWGATYRFPHFAWLADFAAMPRAGVSSSNDNESRGSTMSISHRTEQEEGIDWDLWQHLPKIALWQAVALSLGKTPAEAIDDQFDFTSRPRGPTWSAHGTAEVFGPEYWKRLRIAMANAYGALSAKAMSDAGSHMAHVSVERFGAWAHSIGWRVPNELPGVAPLLLQKWKAQDLWSESDLQALCCGLFPNGARPCTEQLNGAEEAIRRAIMAGSLTVASQPKDATEGDTFYGHARFFRPADATKWAAPKFEKFPFDASDFEATPVQTEGDSKALGLRERTTLLNIVGGLLGLMLGKTPAGQKQSVYQSQSAIIEALLAEYQSKNGIAKSTLEAKLAEAKRSIEAP